MKKLRSEMLSVLAVAAIFGFLASMYSWDGIVYFIENKSGRVPAQATNLDSIKDIKSKHISDNYMNNILENTIVVNTNESTIYKFKKFYTKTNESICSRYSHIKVKFRALNVSVSGEKPHISITADCKIDSNGYITGVTFPKKMLTEISSSEKLLNVNKQVIKLVNIYGQIPEKFKMSDVQFYNEREQASFGSLSISLKNKKNNHIIEFKN